MGNIFKYPKTYHLPLSQTITSDDKLLKDTSCFEGKEVIVSIKMDGEQSNLYSDYFHARSLDSKTHPSRSWVKGLWGNIKHLIPEGWRICGENLYATHSIHYDNLESYFYVFSIWTNDNMCLSYDETLEWCELLGLVHVPVLYRGLWNYNLIMEIFDGLDKDTHEGIVVRNALSFHYDDFKNNVAKAVRKNHVTTDEHWMNKPIVPNGIGSILK